MKAKLLTPAVFLCFITASFSQDKFTTQAIFKATQKVADWQLHALDTGKWKYRSTDWTFGAYYTGAMAWAQLADGGRHLEFLKKIGEQNEWKGGPERFFADDYCIGQTYAQLYMIYKDTMMIKEMKGIGNDIIEKPHTESLSWDFEGGLHNREWAWCDALYMGPPMLAYLSTASGERKYLDIANKLWWRTTEYLYDTSEHLFFRDSRFFQRKEKNGEKVFWSRGNGWVFAGITRMLNNMPDNYKDKAKYVRLFRQMAARIKKLQTPDGTWHVSLLDTESYPVKETSGTAFFVYALTWGINQKYLSYDEYFPTVKKGWEALNECVHPNGMLGFVQVPGAAPDKVGYEDSEVYGTGAFLLAGTELFKLAFNRENVPLKVSVKNNIPVNRSAEMVELSWKYLAASNFSSSNVKVVNAKTGEEVPSQIIFKQNKTAGSLIFQSGAGKAGYACYYILKEKPSSYASKTFGRLVPERLDDFAWENDCIAFRMYGPALQATGEVSSGIDVWGKRTGRLVINDWYKKNDYHNDHGEGMDFYGVGTTLGAGGIAPFPDGRLYPSKNFVSYRVLQNGPLRTEFQLNYAPWKAGNMQVAETKTITLDAGSYLNKIEVNYRFAAPKLSIAIGIARVPQDNDYWSKTGNDHSILAYRQSGDYGSLNIGVLVPRKGEIKQIDSAHKDHYLHTGHFLLTTTLAKGRPLVYYQGASWNRQGIITTMEQWKQYLIDKEQQLKNKLIINVTGKP